MKEKLLTNERYKKYSDDGFIGDSIIHIVAQGTFGAASDFSPGQI